MGAETRSGLRAKALGGLSRFLIFLLVLLLLPSWTFDFWQAWAFWLVFSACTSFISLWLLKHDPALVERRMRIGSAAEQDRTQKRIQAVAGALCVTLIVVPALDHRSGWSSIPWWASLAADGLLALGMAIVFRVFRENSYAAGTIQVEAEQVVVKTGPYAWVRHPMYAGSLMGIFATPIGLGSWWGLIPAALLALAIVKRLIAEEEFLSKNLAGYDEYREITRKRLIPWMW